MGFLAGKRQRKREVAQASEWAEAAGRRLFDEASSFESPFARRVAKSAAQGAPMVVGCLRMSNSPVEIADGEKTELALRRALWAVGLIEVRLCAPLDKMAEIVAECVQELAGDPELAADVERLWSEQVADGAVPAPGGSYDDLLDTGWFRELGTWVIGPATLRNDDVPLGAAIATCCIHLHHAAEVSVPIYAGTI